MSKMFRERIEWCDIWIKDADKNERPRVLLVGDSITRGYYSFVEKELEEVASCARCCTSRFLTDPVYFKELELVLTQYEFNLIHLNNGLHGFDYSESDYENGLPLFFEFVKKMAPAARVAWAASTPIRDKANLGQLDEKNQRVAVRNEAARKIAERLSIPVNDLYSLMVDRPDCWSGDAVHFLEVGYRRLSEHTAAFLRSLLSRK